MLLIDHKTDLERSINKYRLVKWGMVLSSIISKTLPIEKISYITWILSEVLLTQFSYYSLLLSLIKIKIINK